MSLSKERNPAAARRIMKRIADFAEGLMEMPRQGTKYREQETYKMPIPKTRFSMIWKVYKNEVRILKVTHHSQRLRDVKGDWFDLFN